MITYKKDSICVYIDESFFEKIKNLCLEHNGFETGGIIIGYYSPDQTSAIIKDITIAPSDSKSGRASFSRGIYGLANTLKGLWKKGEYYLGEWHYHPGNTSTPSSIDTIQMIEISKNGRFKCPEPILIIAGDNNGTFSYSVNVFRNGIQICLDEAKAEI